MDVHLIRHLIGLVTLSDFGHADFITNKARFITLLVVCIGVTAFAADQPVTQPSSAPDLSTPLAAVITFFQAVDHNDVVAAKAAAVYDAKNEKFIEGVIAESAAEQRYRDAAVKRFGADQRLMDLGSSALVINLAKTEKVHEKGDVADIGEHGDFPCRRVDGKWRLDLTRQNADVKLLDETILYMSKSAEIYNSFASQVSAGKWKSFDEVENAKAATAPPPPPGSD